MKAQWLGWSRYVFHLIASIILRAVNHKYVVSTPPRIVGAGAFFKSERCANNSASAWHAVCAIAVTAALILFAPLEIGVRPVAAQVIPKSLQQSNSEDEIKEAKNAWTVGVVGGLASGTYMRFAVDLARALNDGDNLRILPIVSFGAASNLDDLLYLRGIDVAVTQSDVFEYFRKVRKTDNLEGRVRAFTEKTESRGSPAGTNRIQGLCWSGGQHGWRNHIRRICVGALLVRGKMALPSRKLRSNLE
jgi:hypothetical protein